MDPNNEERKVHSESGDEKDDTPTVPPDTAHEEKGADWDSRPPQYNGTAMQSNGTSWKAAGNSVTAHSDDDVMDEKVPLTRGSWIEEGDASREDSQDDDVVGKDGEEGTDKEVAYEMIKDRLTYRISDNPPLHLTFFFAFQQAMMPFSAGLSITLLVAEMVCARDNEYLKNRILSSALLMIGISTFVMSTFGVRLPIFQGPASTYIIPLLALSNMDEWQCPSRQDLEAYIRNTTNTTDSLEDQVIITPLEFSLPKLQKLQTALILSGILHCLIGLTGFVGFIARFIGPITVVPAITLVGLNVFKVAVKFSETHWGVAWLTTTVIAIFSLYLRKRSTPIPAWSKKRGFHIKWFPLHKMFAVLIGILVGWLVSYLLTVGGLLSSEPTSKQFYARTDSRSYIIQESPWFLLPYPGQFGVPEFNLGAFVSFLVATLMSVLDSIGDYSVCARMCRVPHPPRHAFNRGVAVEGVMSALSGSLGIGHATVSFGGNIALIGLTKVASRRVFQVVALMYVVFALLGKIGAVFITIPYSVLGGVQIVGFGIFIGMVLSNLQHVDLDATRNMAIIGMSILVGMMLPYWVGQNPGFISTGNSYVDRVITMLLANPAFVGGFLACFLDNTVPGTKKERGLLAWQVDLDGEVKDEGEEAEEDKGEGKMEEEYEEGVEVYEPPFIPQRLRRSFLARVFPIFPPPSSPAKSNPGV